MDQHRVIGTCRSMCPVEEFKMREREGLLHKFELPTKTKSIGRGRARPKGRHDLAVKEYSRPAAGRSDPEPSTLRPGHVLHSTIHYLLSSIAGEQHSQGGNWNVVYDFVFDRLRAVRQDLIIQTLTAADAVPILEACVRFHVYSAYRLCEMKMETFDPVINHQHTQECLNRLLYLYMDSGQTDTTQTDTRQTDTRQTDTRQTDTRQTDSRQAKSRQSSRSDGEGGHKTSQDPSSPDTEQCDVVLSSGLKDLTLSARYCGRHQAEFESVYLLYNLGDTDALRHFLSLPRSFRCQHLPRLAYQMSVAYLLGNTLRVLRLASKLPSILCLCAFHRHLSSLQRCGLRVLCSAYSSKNCRFPLAYFAQLLSFDSEDDASAVCKDHGLEVVGGHIHFVKKLHTTSDKVFSRRWEVLEDRLISINLPDLLLGEWGSARKISPPGGACV